MRSSIENIESHWLQNSLLGILDVLDILDVSDIIKVIQNCSLFFSYYNTMEYYIDNNIFILLYL